MPWQMLTTHLLLLDMCVCPSLCVEGAFLSAHPCKQDRTLRCQQRDFEKWA